MMLATTKPSVDDLLTHIGHQNEVRWERDIITLNLIRLDINAVPVDSSDPYFGLLKDIGAWYARLSPADKGKELWLLNQVFNHKKGEIGYQIIGDSGCKWQIHESAELATKRGGFKTIVTGELTCVCSNR